MKAPKCREGNLTCFFFPECCCSQPVGRDLAMFWTDVHGRQRMNPVSFIST